MTEIDGEQVEYVVEKILKHLFKQNAGTRCSDYLVKWFGFPDA